MKATVEWLKEYANIEVPNMELADKLTLTGTKVETVEEKGENIKNVVVGKILSIEKHPDADKLVVTKVDVKSEIIQIVTGANNINVGDIIPVAKDGAELPNNIKIKKGALRGVESCGMMCSIGELELKQEDYKDQIEHGIMILDKSLEEKLGEDITEVLGLKECILDFEITPNRPDCLSIEGLGREAAATLGVEFKAPHTKIDNDVLSNAVQNVEEIEGLTIKIEAPDLCYRYIGRVVKNVKIAESPEWLKRRLRALDVRSINNIVDITNYVMLEMGQPMHAFDINSIEGKSIVVRRAKTDEKITTLDGIERTLTENNLVIADAKKAVAIAGVMGGLNSEIENDTTTIVFESAVFNGPSVRSTAKKVGLRTEASGRYEKGLFPENAERAVNRAIQLVEMLGVGEPVNQKIDVYPTTLPLASIKLEVEKINKRLGIEVSREEMIKILESVDFKIENNIVTPPFYRRDVKGMHDLSEEIIRFYGYDKLPTTLIETDTTVGERTPIQKIENLYRTVLSHNGLSEIYTYGFINKTDLENTNISVEETEKEIIKIMNPLNEEYTIMRTSTLPSMMKVLSTNKYKKNDNVQLFDISKRYRDVNSNIEKGEVPLEEKILTIGMYGKEYDFYYLKGIVENLLETAGVKMYDVQKEQNNSSYHPGRTANLKVGNDVIATLGEIHPIVTENFGINTTVLVAEINVDKVVKYGRQSKKFTPIAKFPAVERDLAIVVDEEIEVGQIEKVIKKKAKKLLEEVKLFDIYRNAEKLGENKKNVAYSLKFRVQDRTLTDEDINPIMIEILAELDKTLGAKIRG